MNGDLTKQLPTHLRDRKRGASFGTTVALVAATTGTVMAFGFFGGVAFLSAYIGLRIAARTRSLRTLNPKNNYGVHLLAAGRTDEAAETFEELAKVAPAGTPSRSLLLYNLAITRMQQGDLDRTIALLMQVIDSENLVGPQGDGAHSLALSAMARCCALRGDVPRAAIWMQQAWQHSTPSRIGALRATEALLYCVEMRFDDGERVLREYWGEIQGATMGVSRKANRLLLAYAISRGGALMHTDEVSQLLMGLKPYQPGDLAYFAHHWPAMREFMRQANLL